MQYILQYIYNASGFDLLKKKEHWKKCSFSLRNFVFSLISSGIFSHISYKLRPPGDYKKVTSLYSTQLHVDTENLSS